MRKKIFLLGCIGVLLSNLFFVRTYADVGVGAQSAVVLEQSSGRILYAKNKDQKLRIASITKIMTAILAVESGKMNDMVTVSNTAVRTEGSSLYLKPGQKIKLADLVYGLMLRSGNDAAQAIAETVGGSIDGFVFLMNKKAEEIGMKNTQFINPHGLDGEGMQHYSSAYDMALLTRYAMQNAGYREIAGTKEHKAPNTEEQWDYVWKNKNKLLTILYEYSTGGKTGFTKQAGRTLVSTASKDGLDLICVTLNDGNDWQDHMNLFNDGFKNYQLSKVIGKGPLPNVSDVYKGHAYVNDTYSYPLTEKEKGTVSVTYDFLDKKEPDDGEKIGTASVYIGKEKVGERAVFYSKSAFKLGALYWLDEIKNVFSAMTGVEQDG